MPVRASQPNNLSLRLQPETIARLDELAADAGTRRATIAKEVLEEIVPRISTIRRRVAISFTKAAE